MELISVNIGQERKIQNAKSSGKTGIYKESVRTPVHINKLGLAGDTICDTENHGGVDQAVYVYGTPDYEWWEESLGRKIVPGTFGENLTISDLESSKFSIGDQLHIGTVVLEVTAPRIPCVTLASRMKDRTFLKKFRSAERPGLYCRVLQEGTVCAGEPVLLKSYSADTVSALEMFRNFFEPDHSEATLRRYLNSPIAIRDRIEKEKKLQETPTLGTTRDSQRAD